MFLFYSTCEKKLIEIGIISVVSDFPALTDPITTSYYGLIALIFPLSLIIDCYVWGNISYYGQSALIIYSSVQLKENLMRWRKSKGCLHLTRFGAKVESLIFSIFSNLLKQFWRLCLLFLLLIFCNFFHYLLLELSQRPI